MLSELSIKMKATEVKVYEKHKKIKLLKLKLDSLSDEKIDKINKK